jgi:enoyl-[acyl-carrier protein] reductase/trans-2-enoyl-CoA reductase (NAD+)
MYGARANLDSDNRLRVDDYELADDVQAQITKDWELVTTENFAEYADVNGYHQAFLKLFGFGIEGVDYEADVSLDQTINNLV